VTTTNWAARLSVGLIVSALIMGFAPSTSADNVATSVYSEAYRSVPPKRVVLSARPTTTSTTTTTRPRATSTTLAPEDPAPVDTYRYYERSPRVVALQEELGVQSVDGIYGPKTRKAHVESLGGPHALLYRNYPEFGQVLTPCSHECEPGDGHYELPTLGELINEYFLPEDRELAHMIAFCESSGQTHHIGSDVVSSALAVGWFQHLAKYWGERSEKAGWGDYHPFHGRANVAVASWLFYSSGVHHWNPSKACWGEL
jgi:hypothetical protein